MNDEKKKKHFEFLQNEVGYKVCSLARKSYVEPAKYKTFECEKCQFPNKVKVLPASIKLKSNVDVYLTADMLVRAAQSAEPIHIILLTCDGDYAEAIGAVLELNPRAHVTVLATPMTKVRNCLSSRLQVFADRRIKNVNLVNIETIKDKISRSSLREKL